jgi:hypothetical protein
MPEIVIKSVGFINIYAENKLISFSFLVIFFFIELIHSLIRPIHFYKYCLKHLIFGRAVVLEYGENEELRICKEENHSSH